MAIGRFFTKLRTIFTFRVIAMRADGPMLKGHVSPVRLLHRPLAARLRPCGPRGQDGFRASHSPAGDHDRTNAFPPPRRARRELSALPLAAEADSAQVIARFGTQIEPYQLEGGVWLPRAPVLVNQDFDFATAMALGPVGAGLAAQKRKEANQKQAALLANVELGAGAKAALASWRQRGVHAFFVLWGAERAVLRLVVERDLTCETHAPP